jgi:hypothetical protein
MIATRIINEVLQFLYLFVGQCQLQGGHARTQQGHIVLNHSLARGLIS